MTKVGKGVSDMSSMTLNKSWEELSKHLLLQQFLNKITIVQYPTWSKSNLTISK
jgi:hypothetical protein